MSALPPIDRAQLPADVRNGSTADQQRYASALSFEQLLTQQLTQQLTDTTSAAGAGDDADGDMGGSDAVSNSYKQMLPATMAQAITSAGGLGLARQLYDGMTESAT